MLVYYMSEGVDNVAKLVGKSVEVILSDVVDILDSSQKLLNTESKIYTLMILCMIDKGKEEAKKHKIELKFDDAEEITKTTLYKKATEMGLEVSKKNFIDNLNQLEKHNIIKFTKAKKYNKTIVTLNKKTLLTKMENHIYACQKLVDRLNT